MIVKLEDSDIQVIELGLGTTYISQVTVSKDTQSSGIAFSNHNDGKIHGDEIIIEITNGKGVALYIRSILDLIKTWDIEGTEEPIAEIMKALEPMLKFDKEEE